jgi:hypothetical protein
MSDHRRGAARHQYVDQPCGHHRICCRPNLQPATVGRRDLAQASLARFADVPLAPAPKAVTARVWLCWARGRRQRWAACLASVARSIADSGRWKLSLDAELLPTKAYSLSYGWLLHSC